MVNMPLCTRFYTSQVVIAGFLPSTVCPFLRLDQQSYDAPAQTIVSLLYASSSDSSCPSLDQNSSVPFQLGNPHGPKLDGPGFSLPLDSIKPPTAPLFRTPFSIWTMSHGSQKPLLYFRKACSWDTKMSSCKLENTHLTARRNYKKNNLGTYLVLHPGPSLGGCQCNLSTCNCGFGVALHAE